MATRMRWFLLAILVAGASCATPAIGPAAGPLYRVTATVMAVPGKTVNACAFEPLPYPPIGCGGAQVVGLDLASAPGAHTYTNGVVETGLVRLVGVWEHGVLNLRSPPTAASSKDATPTPQCAQDQGDAAVPNPPPWAQSILSDDALLKAHNIQLLSFYVCQGSLFIAVAVADRETVDFLTKRYAPVRVAGWLRPVS